VPRSAIAPLFDETWITRGGKSNLKSLQCIYYLGHSRNIQRFLFIILALGFVHKLRHFRGEGLHQCVTSENIFANCKLAYTQVLGGISKVAYFA